MSTKTIEKTDSENTVTELRKLILFNSTHIWDEVVYQLEKATGFNSVHCEQIAMIAHTKGKAVVKSGEDNELEKKLTLF